MKQIIIALLNQLNNHPSLEYAYKNSYIAEDPFELMEKNRFPFFNVVPGDQRVEPLEDMSEQEIERHIYPVTVQFATSSMKINVAIMGDDANNKVGILDFSDDIWEAITFDRTLGGVVHGILPGYATPMDYLKDTDKFIARSELIVEFYIDKGLL